jgi:hypothetical protein
MKVSNIPMMFRPVWLTPIDPRLYPDNAITAATPRNGAPASTPVPPRPSREPVQDRVRRGPRRLAGNVDLHVEDRVMGERGVVALAGDEHGAL